MNSKKLKSILIKNAKEVIFEQNNRSSQIKFRKDVYRDIDNLKWDGLVYKLILEKANKNSFGGQLYFKIKNENFKILDFIIESK
jgi:hypothetical protein